MPVATLARTASLAQTGVSYSTSEGSILPPPRRRAIHRRKSDNEKRRLMREPGDDLVRSMLDTARYSGSSKHKLRPHLYDLQPFNGDRGDATLCDEADFDPTRTAEIPALIRRGIRAGLIGHTGRIVWTVWPTTAGSSRPVRPIAIPQSSTATRFLPPRPSRERCSTGFPAGPRSTAREKTGSPASPAGTGTGSGSARVPDTP